MDTIDWILLAIFFIGITEGLVLILPFLPFIVLYEFIKNRKRRKLKSFAKRQGE